MHLFSRALLAVFALLAITSGIAAIKSYIEYRPPSNAQDEHLAPTHSFEDWRSAFTAQLSKGSTDSTAGSKSPVRVPGNDTLRAIYDALKSREHAPSNHYKMAISSAILPGVLSLLAMGLCALQWRIVKGTPVHHLAPLVPIVFGLVAPSVAFRIGQLSNNYIAGADADLDAAVLTTILSLPMITAFTVPGFLGLAVFLFMSRKSLTPALAWATALIGTAALIAIVLVGHSGMYEILYSRGRRHSTTGIGIMFVSTGCLAASAVISWMAWAAQKFARRSPPTSPTPDVSGTDEQRRR